MESTIEKITTEIKKSINITGNINIDREILIDFICFEPVTKTEKMYKNLVNTFLTDRNIFKSINNINDIFTSFEICIKYVDPDEYIPFDELPKSKIINALLILKKSNIDTIQIDSIISEIIEKHKIKEFKMLLNRVEQKLIEYKNSNVNLL